MFKEKITINTQENKNDDEIEKSLMLRESIHFEIDQLLDKYFSEKKSVNEENDKDSSKGYKEIIDTFILSLRSLAEKEVSSGNVNNFNLAWSQEQVDKIFDILNQNLSNKNLSNIILDRVFTTNSKNEETELQGQSVSDLFAKSIINKLEGKESISINLLDSICNWAQNIHMVDSDILLKLLLAINSHPEKIGVDMRYRIITGVGLFESVFNHLDKKVEEFENISDQLKNLELLRNLANLSDDSGFQRVGEKAKELIIKKTNETQNYFIKTRGQQIMSTNKSNKKSEWSNLINNYGDAELEHAGPRPLLYENNLDSPEHYKEKILNGSHYGKLNEEVGVIYNNLFEVDSFFDIKSNKHINLDAILEREGYSKEKTKEEELESTKLIFKTLISLPLRDKIEKDFNINLSNFTTREQVQFINFISSKDIGFIEKTKKFILGSTNKEAIDNRFISFLSLEVDGGVGEKIIEIGEKFSEKPEVADLLFSKYADLTRNLSKSIDNLEIFYSNIYFDKHIKRDELIKVSLYKFSNLFSLAYEKIKNSSPSDSELEVSILISELDKENFRKDEYLEELRLTATQLNEKYIKLGEDVLSGIASSNNIENETITDDSFKATVYDFGLGEYDRELVMNDFQEHKKFSAERLKEMIVYYQEMAETEQYSSEIMQMVRKDFENEKSRNSEEDIQNFNWSERMEKYSQEFPQPKTKEQVVYEETIRKLQQVLPLQIALEKKMDQLVYGREETKLPNGFSNFESNKVTPENIPEQAPLYFPVGISKDLKSWEQTLSGEKKFAKPIDLYGYLFWLNNQGRKVDLVICDEIQVNNYQIRYGKSESEARQKAGEIGNRETKQYEKIISTFGLKNINIQRYQEFINGNKDDYERYSNVVKDLAIQPAFREAFLSMVQESVSGAEKEEYLGYALEELTWILSANGTKIGHLNEARYDILGAVIRNFEQVGKEQGVDVLSNPESPEAKTILNTVCKLTRDAINEKKSKLDKNSSSLAYFQRLQDHLGKIKTDSKAGYDKSVKKDSLSLNFVCPDVGSASFGFRGDFEAKESVVKFKEPYSTYFYKNDSDLLINSDQVVAASDGLIGGKILTLDNKKQLKYAESVVRPILKHYFASLEKAPAEYFEQVNKNREELLVEAQEATSLLEVLRFVQKYIVKPTHLA